MLFALRLRFDGGLLDVGVNLGQTLIQWERCGGGMYLGIEPNPECVAYAKSLARENGFENITIVPAALSDRAGMIKLDFYTDSEFDSSASIVPHFRDDRPVCKSEYIASITGTELLSEFGMKDVSIVKIDVEGAELMVLRQLEPLFATTRPVIIMETLPAYSASNCARIEAQSCIEDLLAFHDYDLFRLEHDAVHLFGVRKLEAFGIYSDIAMSDHLLVPREYVCDLQGVAAERGLTFR